MRSKIFILAIALSLAAQPVLAMRCRICFIAAMPTAALTVASVVGAMAASVDDKQSETGAGLGQYWNANRPLA